jgi:predicted ATPase
VEGVPPEAARSARGEEELIERTGELDALEASVMAAAAGEGSLLVIEGHAGLGKSRLMTAVIAEARRARMLRLRARPGRFERDFPFGVVRRLFEPVFAGLSPARGRSSSPAPPGSPHRSSTTASQRPH